MLKVQSMWCNAKLLMKSVLTGKEGTPLTAFKPVWLQADKLLSQDFKNMLDEVISFLPHGRQILLYSATFPCTVEEFIVSKSFQSIPVIICKQQTLINISAYL